MDKLLANNQDMKDYLDVRRASIKNKNTDLFYSGVISLSHEDFEWLRERLSLVLEEAIQRIKNSDDETLACLNFDWFEI